jgi:hypothetical protein
VLPDELVVVPPVELDVVLPPPLPPELVLLPPLVDDPEIPASWSSNTKIEPPQPSAKAPNHNPKANRMVCLT